MSANAKVATVLGSIPILRHSGNCGAVLNKIHKFTKNIPLLKVIGISQDEACRHLYKFLPWIAKKEPFTNFSLDNSFKFYLGVIRYRTRTIRVQVQGFPPRSTRFCTISDMEQLPGALGASQALSGLDQASQCTYMAMTSQCSVGEIVSTYRRTKVRRIGKKERHVNISFFKLENLLF